MVASVIYSSFAGNTGRIAKVIAKELGTEAIKVSQLPPEWAPTGLIVIGTSVYAGKPSRALIKWLYDSPSFRGKRAAVFVAAGDEEGQGKDVAKWVAQVLESKGAKVREAFVCKESLLWIFGLGQPSEKEIAGARKFAKKIAPRKRATVKKKIAKPKLKKKKTTPVAKKRKAVKRKPAKNKVKTSKKKK
ncbi:MAG: hypothetical protein GOV00_02055 [Candidatus Altiarchaeota archaeon]|nr:hypothetical protein [Candidatus Altiarchaeota archaeon]